jgi:hypothetical protein
MLHKSSLVIVGTFVAAITAMPDVASASPHRKPASKATPYSVQVDPAYGTARYINDGFDDVCVVNRRWVYNPFTGYGYWKKSRRCYPY